MPDRCSARKPFRRETAWRTRRNTSRARLRNSRVSTSTGGSVARVTSARRGLSSARATRTPAIIAKSRSSDGSTEVNSSLMVSTSLVMPVHQAAHRLGVQVAQGQAHRVVEGLGAQVLHDHLPHVGLQVGLGEGEKQHSGQHEEKPHGRPAQAAEIPGPQRPPRPLASRPRKSCLRDHRHPAAGQETARACLHRPTSGLASQVAAQHQVVGLQQDSLLAQPAFFQAAQRAQLCGGQELQLPDAQGGIQPAQPGQQVGGHLLRGEGPVVGQDVGVHRALHDDRQGQLARGSGQQGSQGEQEDRQVGAQVLQQAAHQGGVVALQDVFGFEKAAHRDPLRLSSSCCRRRMSA